MLPADQKLPQLPRSSDSVDPAALGPASAMEYSVSATPPAALSAAPNLATLLHALRKSWKLAVPVALGAALVAAVLTWLLVPAQYTSTIIFRILAKPLDDDGNFSAIQKSQVALMKSHEVLAEAIEHSRVAELYGVSISPSEMQKKLLTQFNEGPEILTVSLSNPNPEAVAALLNALAEVYPKKTNRTEQLRVQQQIVQLERRLSLDQNRGDATAVPTLGEQLRDKRVELRQVEKEHKLDDIPEYKARLSELRFELNERKRSASATRTSIEGTRAELAAKTERLRKLPIPVISDGEAEESLRNDPDYKDILSNIGKVQKQIDYLKTITNKSAWPQKLAEPRDELAKLNRERMTLLDGARDKVADRVKRSTREKLTGEIEDLEAKLDRLRKEEQTIRLDLTSLEKKVDELDGSGPKAPASVLAVRDQVTQLENEYRRVGEELAKLKGSLPVQPRVVKFSSDAFVPTEKEIGRPLKFSVATAAIVFLCVLGGFCLVEASGRRVYASEEISNSLGLHTVGILPRVSSAVRSKTAAQNLAVADVQFGLTEAVDAIRTVLLHSPRVDGARVVMIASASSGEGKTTLASQLAASLSRAWRKTLLIDGDLRNPNQHKQFEQPLEPGLCEALRGEIEFEDAIRPTPLSRLWLLSAGRIDTHALQALAQDGVGAIFEWLKEQYDFIVIDSSPVLPVPDALMLGKHADAVLLAVMKDVSRMPAVYQAQQRFESLQIRVLGTVVIGEKTEKYGYAVPYTQPKQS